MIVTKITKITAISLIFMMIIGCGKPQTLPDTEDYSTQEIEYTEITEYEVSLSGADSGYKDGYAFAYNGTAVYLGEYTEDVISLLEPADDYYECDSCAFDGVMKMYSYTGFDITTYLKPEDKKDRIYSITFNDDSVSTPEGVYIGQSFDEMTEAYGTEYIENADIPGYYKYIKNGTDLAFNITDKIITSITYQVSDIYN